MSSLQRNRKPRASSAGVADVDSVDEVQIKAARLVVGLARLPAHGVDHVAHLFAGAAVSAGGDRVLHERLRAELVTRLFQIGPSTHRSETPALLDLK
jgi:hypothetical protein